jgi:hypothetical protein
MSRFIIRPTTQTRCTYIFPLMVFNGQVLWQGECMLPPPLYFPIIKYGESSYVNAVFDYVETQLEGYEEDDGDE